MVQKIIQQGAEALLIKDDSKIIKRRIKKSYRLKEIDEKLRRKRTRREAKILEKLYCKINVPKVIDVDENKKEMVIEFIKGKRLSDYLDSLPLKKQLDICKKLGEMIGKMHEEDIIHGDLTTSNMILKNEEIYFIDFGLSFHSKRIEDKAVDLHLLRQALEAKHFKNWEKLFKKIIDNYKSKEKEKVLKQLKKVESRGRYKYNDGRKIK